MHLRLATAPSCSHILPPQHPPQHLIEHCGMAALGSKIACDETWLAKQHIRNSASIGLADISNHALLPLSPSSFTLTAPMPCSLSFMA